MIPEPGITSEVFELIEQTKWLMIAKTQPNTLTPEPKWLSLGGYLDSETGLALKTIKFFEQNTHK